MRYETFETERFRDRADAGRTLAQRLGEYQDRDDVLVLGLPRGGVPVAWEVAHELRAPLDVFLVRKLGVPGHAELAMGAIAQGGIMVTSTDVMDAYGIPQRVVEAVAREEARELRRREVAYRADKGPIDVAKKTVILVDDGLATGATMSAAIEALRALEPAKIVVAAPVGSTSACAQMRKKADDVVCARVPEPLLAVGYAYDDFRQTDDHEVRALLAKPTTEQRHG